MKKGISHQFNSYFKTSLSVLLSLLLVFFLVLPAQSGFLESSWDQVTGATRNREARKNILTVLKELRIIDSTGQINGSSAAATYYFNLLNSSKDSANRGVLSSIPKSERHSGQFWYNVLAGKSIGSPGGFNSFDPRNSIYFEMQKVLMQDTTPFNEKSFADIAFAKGFRHIDITSKALQRSVGVGAGVLIVAVGKIAGISVDIDKILEKQEQLEVMDKLAAKPGKACARLEKYLKEYIEKEIYNQIETKLKGLLGEFKYQALKRKYNTYEGNRQQYMALLKDLHQKTNEEIFKQAHDELNRLPPIIENLRKEMSLLLPEGLICGSEANSQEHETSVIQQNKDIYKSARKHGASHEEATKVVKLIRSDVANDKIKARELIKKIQSRNKTEQKEVNNQDVSVKEDTKEQSTHDPEHHEKVKGNDPTAWEEINDVLTGNEPEETKKVLGDLGTTTEETKSTTPEKSSTEDTILITIEHDTDAAFEKLAKELDKENDNKNIPSSQSNKSFNPPGCFQNVTDVDGEFLDQVRQGVKKAHAEPINKDIKVSTSEEEVDKHSGKREIVELPPNNPINVPDNAIIEEPDIPPGSLADYGSDSVPTLPKKIQVKPEAMPQAPQEEATASLRLRLVTQPKTTVLPPGATVKILACVENSPSDLLLSLPLEYSWKGIDSADGGVASITAKEPETKTISVLVTGKGDKKVSAQAEITLKFGDVGVVITRYPRASVVIGQDIALSAEVQIEDKKADTTSYTYQWQPHPEVQFSPFESSTGNTTATIDAPDTYKVWVEIYQKTSSGTKKLAESEQIEITVQGIDIELSSTPPAPMVGQIVTVQATIKQKIDPKQVRFVWESKGNIKKGSPSADGQSYTFIPVDTKPVTISLRALAKEGDLEELASELTTVTAQKYEVRVSQPKRRGLPPRIWDPQQKELVEQPQGIAVFQYADVHSTLSPKPKGKVKYHWSASPDGCTVSDPYNASTRLNAHEKNTYQLLVKVTDQNNIVLGKGTGTFTVSVSQRDLDVAKQKAADQKKAQELLEKGRELWKQGKLRQAISQVVNAQNIAGKDEEIGKALTGMQQQKQQIDAKLKQAVDLILQGKLEKAEKFLTDAATISDNYSKYKETLQQLADARKKEASLLQQAKEKWIAKEWDTAISLVENVIKIYPDNVEADRLLQKWQKERAAFEQKRDGFIKKGNVAEQQNKLGQAISLFHEAQQIRHDQTLADHVEQLKKRQQDQKIAKKKFDKLIADGYHHEQNNELPLAVQSYLEALKIRSDKKVADHIKELQKRFLNKDQGGVADSKITTPATRKINQDDKFDKLIAKGYQHEQNNELSSAVQVYTKALDIYADRKLSDHIKALRKQILKKNQKHKQAVQDELARQAQKENSERLKKIAQQKRQQRVQKSQKNPATTPWAGTFSGTTSFEDGTITLTFRLRQSGNQISGDGSMRARLFGEDDTGALSLQGTSDGRSATIQLSGDGGSQTISIQLSSSGDRISTNLEGMAFTLRRL